MNILTVIAGSVPLSSYPHVAFLWFLLTCALTFSLSTVTCGNNDESNSMKILALFLGLVIAPIVLGYFCLPILSALLVILLFSGVIFCLYLIFS